MKHLIPTETINKVLQYLAGKSYSEVHSLITEIQKVTELFDSSKYKEVNISCKNSDSESTQ